LADEGTPAPALRTGRRGRGDRDRGDLGVLAGPSDNRGAAAPAAGGAGDRRRIGVQAGALRHDGHPPVPAADDLGTAHRPRCQRAGVAQAPPLSSVGKTEFAWDAPTLAPGSPRGNVLFNAHTWPDDSAMGNRLLDHLHIGGQIIVRGKNVELCYRVTKRFVIDAANGSPAYYARNGPPQLALIVCSPPRLGPGNWKNRTIWFAAPVNQATS
jgi:hypothetical protein